VFTSKSSAIRAPCTAGTTTAIQLQSCQYYDSEAAGAVLVWLAQLAWFIYAVVLTIFNKGKKVRALIPRYGHAALINIVIGLFGYFLYWAGSMAVYTTFDIVAPATIGYPFTADTAMSGATTWHTLAIAFSLGSLLYWLDWARHLMLETLLINAMSLLLYLLTFIYSARRVSVYAGIGSEPCGGISPITNAAIPANDNCNSQRTLVAGFLVMLMALLSNTVLLLWVYCSWKRDMRPFIAAGPAAPAKAGRYDSNWPAVYDST